MLKRSYALGLLAAATLMLSHPAAHASQVEINKQNRLAKCPAVGTAIPFTKTLTKAATRTK